MRRAAGGGRRRGFRRTGRYGEHAHGERGEANVDAEDQLGEESGGQRGGARRRARAVMVLGVGAGAEGEELLPLGGPLHLISWVRPLAHFRR